MTCPTQETIIYLLSSLISPNDHFLKDVKKQGCLELIVLYSEVELNIISPDSSYILLIDARLNEDKLFELQAHSTIQHAQATALVFAPKTPNLALLSLWNNLAGYFYETTPFFHLTEQIREIVNGQNCLPKTLLIAFFKHWQAIYQQQDNQMVQVKLSLTRRELDILTHLQVEQSNLDIADSLFVSEHTVKSHLYRIFKKLNVTNRRQAINWAQLYL